MKHRCAHCHHARRHATVYDFGALKLCYHHLKWAELNAARAWLDSKSQFSSDTGANR